MNGNPLVRSLYALTTSEAKQADGMELTKLLVESLKDGTLSEKEVFRLAVWLDQNRNSSVPAIGYLLGLLEQLGNRAATTPEGRSVVAQTAKSVLPPYWFKIVQRTGMTRDAREAGAAEASNRIAKEVADRERFRNTALREWYFAVAGCKYDNRQEAVSMLRGGDQLVVGRDPSNPHSRFAIRLRHPVSGQDVGFVKEKCAVELAPMLDAGHPVTVTVVRFRVFRGVNYPFVVARAFPLQASITTLTKPTGVSNPELVIRTRKQPIIRESSGCLLLATAVVTGVFSILLAGMSFAFSVPNKAPAQASEEITHGQSTAKI